MLKKIFFVFGLIVSTSSFAAPKVENLPVNDTVIPNTVRLSTGDNYDSYSFRFQTGSTKDLYGTIWHGRNGESSGRYGVISTSPNSFNPVNGNKMCGYANYGIARTIKWTTSDNYLKKNNGCTLQPNTVYYFNVKSESPCTSGDSESCSFKLSGRANYKWTNGM